MHHLFTPHHVQILNSCYPPSSALANAGPNYSPNTQEISRLTYHASNHPSKLTKLGSELEKRVRNECKKARAGNVRSRASLLISLAIIRSLAIECRRDISLLSPSLLACVELSIASLPEDLGIAARAASVFTAWTTYTDGHIIGADAIITNSYLSSLRHFASLGCNEKADHEVRNRTRLFGLAALTGAINSEALYNDSTQFQAQVAILINPILNNLFQTPLETLDEQANTVKDVPASPYLAEFRTRPTMERRAASIHVHIDGEKGPSMADVSNAALHALYSLLEHANGVQLGHIMRSCCDNLEAKNWRNLEHCRWLAQKMAEWSQFQYRYVVPTWLVERLLENQESADSSPLNSTLVVMVATVLNSPTPLINLSTSDIIANLLTLLLRRATVQSEDNLMFPLIDCIASLGRHVYYTDQVLDLAGELINRIVVVEAQGIVAKGKHDFDLARSKAIRCLLASLQGLIRTADMYDLSKDQEETHRSPRSSFEVSKKDSGITHHGSRRTRVPPDIWQDTLSLLCDNDYSVRSDYWEVLVFFIANEMPKDGSFTTADYSGSGDLCTKFLHATHAYLYILATTSKLGLVSNSSSPVHSVHEDSMRLNILPATPIRDHHSVDVERFARSESPTQSHSNGRRSFSVSQGPQSRKVSVVRHLLEHTPPRISVTTSASLGDYAHILHILTTLLEQFPVRTLLTGIPMLLALGAATNTKDIEDPVVLQRANTIQEIITNSWLVVGKAWGAAELVELAEKALLQISEPAIIPALFQPATALHPAPKQPILFPRPEPNSITAWTGVNTEEALFLLSSSARLQEAAGMEQDTLLRRLSTKWTATSALRESVERSSGFDSTMRGDGVSPLLKISPALMHIENISLQSLARSTRGVGVTDLREALEGRSSMSNPALVHPPSISTLDHTSSVFGGELHKLAQTRSRSRAKKLPASSGAGEVRDVLNRLGIGKQPGSLLKASFPALQKTEQRVASTSEGA